MDAIATSAAAGATIAVCGFLNPAALWLLAVWAPATLVLLWVHRKRSAVQ